MENFFGFLDQNRSGIFVLGALIVFVVLMIQWLAWIFRVGHYQRTATVTGSKTAQFVFGEFLAKVISDFRNLLAVLIVLVFALILMVAILRSNNQEEMASALQAVMATLGGLVGSIVGYYFGESAVKGGGAGTPPTNIAPPMQNQAATGVGSDDEDVMLAPAPPKPTNDTTPSGAKG